MRNEPATKSPVAVLFTPEFKRNLRQLVKKYRHIKTDIQPLLDELEQGQTPGDQIPGIQYEVFKARARNSDSGKGKSGGYQVIYHCTTEGTIILVTLYSKTEQEDIAAQEIRRIILTHETQQMIESSEADAEHNATTESETESDA